ncbi:MAG: sodium:calcium antiporter, partial [Bacteroidales bacterium]|nr:sodium:calcium antiporter [Bacteroidales bacterium]
MDIIISVVGFIAGIAIILYGANFLVRGASALARKFKISELIIGLTIVALGTSL